jgi:hypothetical protein
MDTNSYIPMTVKGIAKIGDKQISGFRQKSGAFTHKKRGILLRFPYFLLQAVPRWFPGSWQSMPGWNAASAEKSAYGC